MQRSVSELAWQRDVSRIRKETRMDRLDAVWRSKKDQARNEKKVVTRMVPGWLTVQRGEIVPLPDRVATLRKILPLEAADRQTPAARFQDHRPHMDCGAQLRLAWPQSGD
jgi:hypothetical protein